MANRPTDQNGQRQQSSCLHKLLAEDDRFRIQLDVSRKKVQRYETKIYTKREPEFYFEPFGDQNLAFMRRSKNNELYGMWRNGLFHPNSHHVDRLNYFAKLNLGPDMKLASNQVIKNPYEPNEKPKLLFTDTPIVFKDSDDSCQDAVITNGIKRDRKPMLPRNQTHVKKFSYPSKLRRRPRLPIVIENKETKNEDNELYDDCVNIMP